DRLKTKQKLALIVSELVRRRYRGGLYAKAQNARNAIRAAFDKAFADVDVLAMPTCLDVAPLYVEPKEKLSKRAFETLGTGDLPRTRSTSGFNYTGHPAMSVPCGRSGGLPIGMQLVGRYYDEAILFRAAYAFQHSVDWDAMTALPARATAASR